MFRPPLQSKLKRTGTHYCNGTFEHRFSCSGTGFKSLKRCHSIHRVCVLSRASRVSVRSRRSFWYCVPTLRSLETKFEISNMKLVSKFISREKLFSDSVWWVWAWYMSYLSSRGSVSLATHQVSRPSELTSTKKFMKRSVEKKVLSIQNDSIPCSQPQNGILTICPFI